MFPAGFDYLPAYLDAGTADEMLARLWRDLPWRQYPITLFGKTHLQPRLTAWNSDPGIHYRYSGTGLAPTPWHPDLSVLRDRLKRELAVDFNSVLINAYRDGQDAMGWHADNEPELGRAPTIASLSLGQQRRMLVRPVAGGRSRPLQLEHGSLLVMSGQSQDQWQHAVPRSKRATGLRINLTFRRIVSALDGGSGAAR